MRDKSPLEFCCLPIRCIENNLLIHCIIVELLFLSWKNVNVPFLNILGDFFLLV